MVNKIKLQTTFFGFILVLFLMGCNEKNLEGSYIVLKENKPIKSNSQYVIATLGEKNFSFNSGVGGTYEISNNKVIVQGHFSHVFEIKENDLVSDKWYLKKSTEKEIEVLQTRAKEEKVNNAPVIGNEQRVTKW